MILTFAFPSMRERTGGVIALYEFCNALAQRGHEIHFAHGPALPMRVDSLDELPPFDFDPGIHHYLVDAFDDPSLPDGDVFFAHGPPRLGLEAVVIQGFRMMPLEMEVDHYRARAPKVCVARWLTDVGRMLGVPDEQLWHIPMGIDHEIFATRTAAAARRYDIAMLYNDHPEKGWDAGRRALWEAKARRPSLTGAVFGMNVPPDDLPPDFDLHVGLDHQQLADEVYNQSRVFLQSSTHEGFGFTAVEAMACGVALVTTDNGGSDDYAIASETALVVPPNDVEAMAERLVALVEDDERRERLARAGASYVRRFEWSRGAELLEARLEAYLAEPERFCAAPAELTPERRASLDATARARG